MEAEVGRGPPLKMNESNIGSKKIITPIHSECGISPHHVGVHGVANRIADNAIAEGITDEDVSYHVWPDATRASSTKNQ